MKQCNFTERERRVLVQLARLDFNTRDIAALFGCSSATVSYHIRNKGQAKPRTLPPVDKARMEQRRKIITTGGLATKRPYSANSERRQRLDSTARL